MQGKHTDISGRSFGFWKVNKSVKRPAGSQNQKDYYDVTCVCGARAIRRGSALLTGHSKSCGCKKSRLRPYEALFNLFVRKAKERTLEVTISYNDFVKFCAVKECHYCATPVLFEVYGARGCRYNLDRKDNSIGYSLNNLVVCCQDCNFGKGNRYTYEEWWVMARALKRHRTIRFWQKNPVDKAGQE